MITYYRTILRNTNGSVFRVLTVCQSLDEAAGDYLELIKLYPEFWEKGSSLVVDVDTYET